MDDLLRDAAARAIRYRRDVGNRPVWPEAAALDALVKRHRDAGLEVNLEVSGDRRALPPATDQAAYRILQESLTNALRHGAGRADVTLAYDDDALEIQVANPARRDDTEAGDSDAAPSTVH